MSRNEYSLEFIAASIRQLRRLFIFIVGGSVVLVGIVMIVTPGPATVVIPAGLAILAIEFVWARRLLKKTIAMAEAQKKKVEHAVAMRMNRASGHDVSPPLPPA